jgi:soluble lytic murein transglycosylase-like protein
LNNKLPLALAAYNAGPAKVLAQSEIPPIEETRDYVQKVLRNYKNFKYQKNDLGKKY